MDITDHHSWLSKVDGPSDLRDLPPEALTPLCAEIRECIIDVLSETPGHFGSSLGAVELAVALHYVFDTPSDRIVWDVGHQAYAHKIITGRKDVFHTLRKWGGMSGFPNSAESEYDSFIAGHASNSISAALGMSVAMRLKHDDPEQQVIAVLGDGSMTGGLAYEGLNNTSSNPNNLLIILNDNNMAIDHNVGGISDYLVDITTSRAYNKVRYDVYRALRKFNIITEDRRASILRFNNSLKSLLTNQHNIFEGMNIRYFGPVDGNDVHQLVRIMRDIKHMKGPKLLHIHTVKGKGFKPAEEMPSEWHAPGKFDKKTGIRSITTEPKDAPSLYQDVFGETLLDLARDNERVMGVTAAMPTGTSVSLLMKEMPERAFDVGIAEAHAITFAAGLAKEGMLPFCAIYSSFMQRAYDQVIHDVAMQNLHVVICVDRAGLVGEDGMTHHGYFDLAAFRPVPNLTIASPIDEADLRNLMYTATLHNGPFMLRYPRGRGEVALDWRKPFEQMPIGKGKKLSDGKDLALLSIGSIGNIAAKAIEQAREKGVECAHYDMVFLKPLDEALLDEVGKNYKKIITVENGMITGGLGSAVLEFMADRGYTPRVKRIGIPDNFVQHGTVAQLEAACGMDADAIVKAIVSITEEN